MAYHELLTIIIGVDLGLAGIAAIFAGAWVKASRIEKIHSEIDKLWEKVSTVSVLETKIEAIESLIREIKDLLKR